MSILVFAIAISLLIARRIRARLTSRPTLGASIVVTGTSIGIVVGLLLVRWCQNYEEEQQSYQALTHMSDPICEGPEPSQPDGIALREIACTQGARWADLGDSSAPHLRAGNSAVGVNVQMTDHVAIVLANRLPPAQPGHVYRVWFLDRAGTVLAQVEPDANAPKYVRSTKLASATEVALSLETTAPSSPTAVMARAALRDRE